MRVGCKGMSEEVGPDLFAEKARHASVANVFGPSVCTVRAHKGSIYPRPTLPRAGASLRSRALAVV